MAISHAQPLLLLVLVSLFFFPTLGHDFTPCTLLYFPLEVTALEISPNPIKEDRLVNFTISGNANQVVFEDGGAAISLEIMSTTLKSQTPYVWYYSLCKLTRCPISRGPFNFTVATRVPIDIFKTPNASAKVSITERETPGRQLMCIKFTFQMPQYISEVLV